MEAVVAGQADQGQRAAAAIDGELEVGVELVGVGQRDRVTALTPPVAAEQEGEHAEPFTVGARAAPGRARRLVRRLHPATVARACIRWMRHPAHLALVAWTLCVAASGAMLGLLLVGALNGAFPRRRIRNRWIEINNQILNALFTLMSIYQHPALFHHAVLLLRWRPADAKELRAVYRRKGAAPATGGERADMSVVVALLHVTCFAQYALCGLYWGYSRKARPDAADTTLTVVGTAAPVLAGLYMYFSPLGRKRGRSVHHQEPDNNDGDDEVVEVVVVGAEWAGGLLDVGDDPTACWLSCLCTFGVFGWNMERLGLGNARVHAVMFALLCFAPLWVLNVTALNIRDEAVRDTVGAAGAVLCVLGLLYGGFWRMRMRRRFGLPADTGCCACAGPYLRWMFCWGCALAQEVRTANQLLRVPDVEAGGVPDGGPADAVAVTLQPSQIATAGNIDAHPDQLGNGSPCRGDDSPLLRQEQGNSSSSGAMRAPVPPAMPEGRDATSGCFR